MNSLQKRNFGNVILTVMFLIVIVALNAVNIITGNVPSVISVLTETEEASGDLLRSDLLNNICLNLAGTLTKFVNMDGYYNNIGIYITKDRYIVGYSPYSDTEYETEQMKRLKAYLDEKDTGLIYVNLPVKYTDDAVFVKEFGRESYRNRNADLLLQNLSDAGIPTLDMRAEAAKDGLNVKELFYRTDHHWTVPAGFWAAGKIAGALNQYAGFSVDLSLYDKENYTFTTIPECWVGEQGVMVSPVYIGYDDYTYVVPNFPTSFLFKLQNQHGDFSKFVAMETIEAAKTEKDFFGMHYAYSKPEVSNDLVDSGKVLLVCDSYANAYMAFLALGISETDVIVPRSSELTVYEKLEQNDYDAVVISYAEFMIGAHEQPGNVNGNMFTFFGDES